MIKLHRIVLLALLVSQAMVLSFIETFIPNPVPIPGFKLGLANIVTMLVIFFFGFGDAVLVVVVRCALSAILFGGPVVFIFSLAGGILSTVVMSVLYYRMREMLSIIGISMAGAVAHNAGQLVAAVVLMGTLSVFSYLPVLLIAGLVTGFITGVCSRQLSKAFQKWRRSEGQNREK